MCLGTGEFLRPQGAIPPGFYSLRGVRFIAWRLRGPKKGNADGVEGIVDLAGRLKNGLMPYSCVGGTYDK